MAGDAESLSTVDLAPFMREEGCVVGEEPTAEQVAVAAEINAVCAGSGFLYLKNFGVSEAIVAEAFDQCKRLFALGDDAKVRIKPYAPETNTGFSKFASEALNTRRPPDLKEAFNVRCREHFENDYAGMPEGWGRDYYAFSRRRRRPVSMII